MGQTQKNFGVYYKLEDVFNTAPGITGAKRLRTTSGAGLALKRANIKSNEARLDGQTAMSRKGSNSVGGSYPVEVSVGSLDDMIGAVMRSDWTASFDITEAEMTSITTQEDGITAAAGSWLTQNVRAGDIVRLSGHSTAGNNDKNLRVLGVTAAKITVPPGDLTADAAADLAFTLTVLRKIKFGSTPSRRSWYVEEYNQDIDSSEVFGGNRVSMIKLTGQPDGMCLAEVTFVGVSAAPLGPGAASPYFTPVTENTAALLVWTDALIRFGGEDVELTSFEVTINLNCTTLPVMGSNTSPDVYEDNAVITGQVAMPRADLANLTRLKNETELELHILLVEPESEPKDCLAFFAARLKLGDVGKSFGGSGAMIESIPFEVGKVEGVSGYDDSMCTWSTSAA